ncbi:hypothetical protein BZB76_5593 [Actinomadura pelletieri DSM 43383]|uniref:Uncharacterized protein n=1 Tax=Actinomadura pelletieri DSM 43383 TaxID=1120940 RepID=A0A495QGS1_9ACTN|nr:hypothetical protein [Actinomadura pelletieri]RKS71107.1 hypothetical protein BZB76_5593 [Actinomadura pelletieri DSM 43383]
MLRMSARSPLILPWATLKLAGRFLLPLALWFTVGELLRYGAMYGGYRLGSMKGTAATVAPIATIGLLVVITLTVAVLMVHSVREGLDVVHAREADGDLTPWAVGNEESVVGALGRAALPFVIFYLAWGLQGEDAREFADMAASRGFAEGGIQGQIDSLGMLLSLEKHIGLAIGLTAGLFVLKVAAEWRLEERLPRAVGALVAFLEINFALFGIFTIDHLRNKGTEWFTERQAWAWVTDVAGPALQLWGPFKEAVLGALIWLVIAGVILGLDARDEQIVLGRSRAAQRLARAGGVDRVNSPREILTRGLREMWLPAWYGLRLVRRSGMMPFATFCLLFAGLDLAEEGSRRFVYELIGPHEVTWWIQALPFVGYGTALVFEILRICLLAAAFNLVMARVTARTAAKAVDPPDPSVPSSGPVSPAPTSPPWYGAQSP